MIEIVDLDGDPVVTMTLENPRKNLDAVVITAMTPMIRLPAYRAFQEARLARHPGFQPIHIPSKTHFLTLESPAEAAASIISLSGVGHARLG